MTLFESIILVLVVARTHLSICVTHTHLLGSWLLRDFAASTNSVMYSSDSSCSALCLLGCILLCGCMCFSYRPLCRCCA